MKETLTAAELSERNPSIHLNVITIYLDALSLYREASENIAKNGAVTGHPKTGAPITNPFLPIRDLASKTISNFHKDFPKFESSETKRGADAGGLGDLDIGSLLGQLDGQRHQRKHGKK